MTVETDDDRAGFFNLDEFGGVATWTHAGTAKLVAGIFPRSKAVIVTGNGPGTVVTDAKFVCQLVQLPPGAGQNDTLEIDGVAWIVRSFLPDGTGFVHGDLEAVS